MPDPCKMIDLGANMLDSMFQGEYNGSQKHQADLETVLTRAWDAGVERIIITAGNLEEAKGAIGLAKTHDRLYSTVGVHPTRCGELFNTEGGAYLSQLLSICEEGKSLGKVVAVGEFGLDYDRFHFCDKETQLKGFELQFRLAEATGLPLFLHMREAAADFIAVIRANRSRFSHGVVHSFTGSLQEATDLIAEDLYIGINGCSLKTQEQLDTVKAIPLERIMLETDAPWCEIRPTHAGSSFVKTQWPTKKKEKFEAGQCVKGRQEPCHLIQVVEVVAGIKGLTVAEVASVVYENTMKVFWPNECRESSIK